MSIEKRQTKSGTIYRFDKTINRVRLKSRYIYTSKKAALEAELKTAAEFLNHGRIMIHTESDRKQKTVMELLNERLDYLFEHKSKKHANETKNVFKTVLKYAPKWKDMPISAITLEMVREMAESWRKDLEFRGKTAGMVNRALKYLTSAWNGPWDSKRAPRHYDYNPFKLLDHYPVQERVRFIPETSTIERIVKAAETLDTTEIGLYIRVLYETAARPSEPLAIKWDHILADKGILILFTRKRVGGQLTQRRLKISDELLALFYEQTAKR